LRLPGEDRAGGVAGTLASVAADGAVGIIAGALVLAGVTLVQRLVRGAQAAT